MRLEIQDKLRAQDVKRWGVVATVIPQSLAEHSYNVTMITIAILDEISPYRRVDHKIRCQAIEYALNHDLEEIITGDIPSPAKNDVVVKSTTKSVDIPKPDHRDIIDIVKVADLMDTTMFICQYAVGIHANRVKADMVSQIEALLGSNDMELDQPVLDGCRRVWESMSEGPTKINSRDELV